MAKIQLENMHGLRTDITTKAFEKDPEGESYGIIIDGVYVGGFYVTERNGRPAIAFGAHNEDTEDFDDVLDHPRAVGDEGALFLPKELANILD
jgi:hypothetical protein